MILGATTLAVMLILCPFALIALTNGVQGDNCIPDKGDRPLLPCESSAKAIVTINSTHKLFGVHFMLYQNEKLEGEGDLSPGSSIIRTVTIIFPTNESGSYQVVILATSSWNGFLGSSDEAILTVKCNHTYPVFLEV